MREVPAEDAVTRRLKEGNQRNRQEFCPVK